VPRRRSRESGPSAAQAHRCRFDGDGVCARPRPAQHRIQRRRARELEKRLNGQPLTMTYELGTAQCDAHFAGWGEGHDVRVIDRDGEPWFVGIDVAEVLGYADPKQAVKLHCKARKPLSELKGGNLPPLPPMHPQTNMIPERDVYRLIMRSKLESAERFEELVVGEILPSIRKTGRYEAPRKESQPPRRRSRNCSRAAQGRRHPA
jgi:BRO family, N-terminal domain